MLKIIKGDKRIPNYTLALDSLDGIALSVEGSTFSAAKKNLLYSGLQTGRDGQRRINTTRDNAEIQLNYRINGGDGPARLVQLQRDLARLDLDIRKYEEQGIGEPTYLAYRLNDGLDLPEPVLGQFSLFVRILHIDIKEWAANAANPGIRQMVTGTSATLTVAPYAEGAEQICGQVTGGIKVDPQWGLIVLDDTTNANLFTNPSFAHTTWDTGWTVTAVSGAISKTQITSGARSYDSAVFVSHQGIAGTGTLTQNITLTQAENFISCYARLPEGGTPASTDFQMYINSTALTTYYVDNGDGWYLCWAKVDESAAAFDAGVVVKADKVVIFDDFLLAPTLYTSPSAEADLFPPPFVNGDYLGCEWDSTAHNSKTTVPKDGRLNWDIDTAFFDNFTIALWTTPTYLEHDDSGSNVPYIWQYYVNSFEYVGLRYLPHASGPKLRLIKNGGTDDDFTPSIKANTPVHLTVVQTDSAVQLYINGAVKSSIELTAIDTNFVDSGGFWLGASTANSRKTQWATDGLMLWDRDLTAAEISQLYNNQKDVKANGDMLGMPPFVWTYDNDGKIENDMDTTANDYNYAVVGGVTGDLPASVKILYNDYDTYEEDVLFIGVKAIDYSQPINMNNVWWLDMSSVAGQTEGTGEFFTDTLTLRPEQLAAWEGKFRVIAVYSNSPSAAGSTHTHTIRLDISDHDQYTWDNRSFDSTSFLTQYAVDIGDAIYKRTYVKAGTVPTISPNILVDPVLTSNWEMSDLFILPYPLTKITGMESSSFTNTDQLMVEGRQASLHTTVDANEFSVVSYEGDTLEVLPGKMNWLFHLLLDDVGGVPGRAYNQDNSFKIGELHITPRFNLLGGPIA